MRPNDAVVHVTPTQRDQRRLKLLWRLQIVYDEDQCVPNHFDEMCLIDVCKERFHIGIHREELLVEVFGELSTMWLNELEGAFDEDELLLLQCFHLFVKGHL